MSAGNSFNVTPGERWRAGADSSLLALTPRLQLQTLTPDSVNDVYLNWWNDPLIQERPGSEPRAWTLEHARRHVMRFDNRWSRPIRSSEST